ALEETLEELCKFFEELRASAKLPPLDRRPVTTVHEGDDELLYLFSPLLRKLNLLANTLDAWGGFSTYQDDRKYIRQVTELNAAFARFKAAVK
ncbi:hypothetical protein FRC00_006974, partial [Tulasnella sp. 408]